LTNRIKLVPTYNLYNFPTKNKTHTVCQLSGVSTRFQMYRPCLHVANRNARVNGANFAVNRHKTRVNTLKSLYSIQTCLHSLIFGRVAEEIHEDAHKVYPN